LRRAVERAAVPMKNAISNLFLCALMAVAAPALAQRGAQPSPPPPDQALHVYRETIDGGVQIVVDHELKRAELQALRGRLRAQAKQFERGEFALAANAIPPASLGALKAGATHITVTYTDVDDGGAIRLKTSDPALIHAIYDYFAAQVAAERRAHPLGGPGNT
jgi:hypothetical protein